MDQQQWQELLKEHQRQEEVAKKMKMQPVDRALMRFCASDRNEEELQFLLAQVTRYIIEDDLYEYELVESLQEYMVEVDVETLEKTTPGCRRSLKNLLHQRGVFVKSGKHITIAEAIMKIVSNGFDD